MTSKQKNKETMSRQIIEGFIFNQNDISNLTTMEDLTQKKISRQLDNAYRIQSIEESIKSIKQNMEKMNQMYKKMNQRLDKIQNFIFGENNEPPKVQIQIEQPKRVLKRQQQYSKFPKPQLQKFE